MKIFSINDILGPIMIGPSSSHTAGAAKLGLIAKKINNKVIHKVVFHLGGSFAKTYKGHGTDKALLAGVLGFSEDDKNIKNSLIIADHQHLIYEFVEADLDGYHPNTVCFEFFNVDGSTTSVIGSSIGGGNITINKINNYTVSFTGDYPTIIISHIDKPGVTSHITGILTKEKINIASMNVTRESKNRKASTVIESDNPIGENIKHQILASPDILNVEIIQGA